MNRPTPAPLKPIKLPELKPIGTDSVSKKQSLQEWHAAGGGVPLQYKGREHVWHAKVKKFAEGGEVQMAGGGVMKGLLGAFNEASKAADAAIASKRALPAAERDANLQKFLEPSKAPMRLYHGTTATEGGKGTEAIRRIKPSKEGSLGSGVYLTPDSGRASGYAASPWDSKLNLDRHSPNVLPVHAQIRNPLIIEGTHGDPMIEALMKLGMDETSASKMVERAYEQKGYIGKQVESRARAAGYDGLMQYRNGDLSEVVSYNPNAVKSAIGNQGTYDTSIPDLSKAKGGEVQMKKGGDPLDEFSPPRYRSAGRRPESQQDRKAAANMPMDFARGVASGVLGAPGDIESLIRMLPGLNERTVLPTSEDIEKRIPLRSDTPAGRAAAGLGTLAGGFYMGPGAPIRLVGGLPQAVYKAGKDFGRAAGQPAANVVKPTGGNFLTGRTEKDLSSLKRGVVNEEAARRLMGDAFTNERMADPVNNALNKWVDSNLTNYVKKQMGTPDDPVRKLAEEGITHKPGLVDDYNPDYFDPELMGRRQLAGFPEEGIGQSPMARTWEQASDASIISHRAGDIQEMPEKYAKREAAKNKLIAVEDDINKKYIQKLEKAGLNREEIGILVRITTLSEKAQASGSKNYSLASGEVRSLTAPRMDSYMTLSRENPWISKVNPETQLYETGTYDLGFDHIMDVLREDLTAGRIRPEQMSKISIADAVRRTYQYDQELAAKMNASRAAAREGLPVHKEYPEGYRWVELNKPGSFAQESEAMGHSVRGYEPPKGHPDWAEGSGDAGSSSYGHGGWEAIKSGKAKVYSLVDPKGAPHATVEVGPTHRDRGFFGDQRPTGDEYYSQMNKYVAGQNDGTVSPKLTFAEWWRASQGIPEPEALAPRISQIKGKQNRAPNEEYLPYIQDFVKGGQWSDVGDIQNTGLISIAPDSELATSFRRMGKTPPAHVTQNELTNLIKWNRGEGELPEGMAHGGAVHMAGGGLLKSGLKKLLGAAEEVPKGVEPIVVKAAERAAAGKKAAELIKSQPQIKASEALGQAMEKGFKKTTTTQADRTRVGGGNIGGAPFSAISEADPAYAGKVWGVMDEGTAARLKNLTTPDTAWTTMLGSANQLKTNPIVFDKLKKGFLESMKAGNLTPELEAKINHNLALTFGEGAQIRDPNIWKQADTFEKRAALADLMMGQGIPPGKGGVPLGGEKSGKGVIFKPTDILKRETEPSLLHTEHGGNAPTFAAGPRLFSMDPVSEFRPDLHPGFPTMIGGKDLGVNMNPTPTEVYLPEWHRNFKKANPDRKGPGYYDLALGVKGEGLPSQKIDDEYIRHLLREGYKKGGRVGGLTAATES